MQITKNVYNVGVNGNNSYLITGNKTALIDTVVREYADELIENIEKIMPVTDIDYLVFTSTFSDKSGAAAHILSRNPDIEVVATVAGLCNLKEITNSALNEHLAKDGDILDLGNGMSLKFIITPNLPWPDSMAVYESSKELLFSGGLFSHENLTGRFWEDMKYFYDVHLRNHTDFVRFALEKLAELKVNILCPWHGYEIKKDKADRAKELYKRLSKAAEHNTKKIAVIYGSLYGATEAMSEVISGTLAKQGLDVAVYDALNGHSSDDIDKIEQSDAIIAGSFTREKGADKMVIDILTAADVSALKGKPFFTFGSYGWSGEGPQIVHNLLKSYGMKPFSKPFMSIFNMSDEKKDELIKHTQEFAEFISKENSK